MTTDEVLKESIDEILKDIISLYESEGKKVSGQFIEGLKVIYKPFEATIQGYKYLAGRPPGKMPPVKNLEAWVRQKGIFQVQKDYQYRGIAYVIAKKIAEQGTSKQYELKVYQEVITPERIDKIIDRITELNVNRIVNQIRAELEVLAVNI